MGRGNVAFNSNHGMIFMKRWDEVNWRFGKISIIQHGIGMHA
jgi:hypothetical protein